ncbi:putative methyltransferase BTM2-like protein [Trypanosoma cruzi]|uniref:Probable methyltransferase BMT2 homolog n=1 Tax=Trypanosoma cruzi TaxID=5693 RepID=A0A7J6YEN3_TRYCR|nr:putative methyltransferase BTM2-like protein [Trypanosoma cruzi]
MEEDKMGCRDDGPTSRGEWLSRAEAKDHQLELANTIKSFHYRLQQRMSTETSAFLSPKKGQKEEEKNEEAIWSRLIAEEGENMKAYATAMHAIATRYWDPDQEGNEENVSGFRSHVTSTAGGVTRTRSRCQRDNGGEEGGNQNGRSSSGPSRHNDRVAYSLHCVADYYLGSCLPLVNTEQQLKHHHHDGTHDVSSFDKSHPGHSSIVECTGIYEQIPRIATNTIKIWRRAFYAAHGRQATATEVENATYDALCLHGCEGEKSQERRGNLPLEPLLYKTLLSTCGQGKLTSSAATLAGTYMSATRNEVRRRRFTNGGDTPPETFLPLQVLDVGSCYGPFKGKTITNGVLQVRLAVTAIDLCPFEGSNVLQGDWLAVRFYDVGERQKEEYSEGVGTESLVRTGDDADGVTKTPKSTLWVARGQFDAVFFCLMLSFLPHPRLRYRACLHAHLALKDGGLLVIVSTRTQCTRRGSWVDDWVTCIEGIGFKRVHKHIMGQVVGLSFSKEAGPEIEGDTAEWLGSMMARPEAECGLRILGDDCC